jgi:hypothetical protein
MIIFTETIKHKLRYFIENETARFIFMIIILIKNIHSEILIYSNSIRKKTGHAFS